MQEQSIPKDLARVPGIEPSAKIDAWWGLVLAVVGMIIALVVIAPDPYYRILKFVQDGVWVTLYTTIVAFIITLLTGLVGGLGRLSKNVIVRGISTLYVELIRGIPLLVQLIWWYFAFPVIIQSLGRMIHFHPLISYQANPYLMAILGLTFCYGAYMSEIYRAGIQSISKGQMEAARSLGMSYFQAMRYIILPQAIRVILPPVGNEFISLLKDSSLVSAVAVADLTRRGREFMSTNFNPIEVWSMVALIYLVGTLLSSRVVAWTEHRTRIER